MFNNYRLQLSKEYIYGKEISKNYSVSICSIVRDCELNLKKNIPRIEQLRTFFKDSEVVVFENDSKDDTKKTLLKWGSESAQVHVFTDTFGSTTVPSKKSIEGNPYYSISRIEKMVSYRNKYIHFLNSQGFRRDLVLIIDLDISGFDIDGILHSIGTEIDWDCISANGTSVSSEFKKQYHDSYALIEYGKLNHTQTEDSIRLNRIRYSFLRQGMPLLHVDSAYGGLAIYKWASIKDIYYSYLLNNDKKVECKSEHVGLHKIMKEKGCNNIFINPSMKVKYRSVSLPFLISKLQERVSTNKQH
jgi:glycosyltransferase involved in cell wall biosynthesis